MSDRTYYIKILSEPDEQPIEMTQDDLDVLLALSTTEAVSTYLTTRENLVEFASVSTSDDGPIRFRGHDLADAQAEAMVSTALARALTLALREHQANSPQDSRE